MPKFLKIFFGFFTPYVSNFERKVDRFFQSVKSTDDIYVVRKNLLKLMQKDLIVVNVWLEKRFKGYRYLTKKARRQMYEAAAEIVKKFEEFRVGQNVDIGEEKMRYLNEIMNFLKPGVYYQYIKTASFGKLLRNPDEQKLEGDCNQIVTLYMYLYSLKFPLEDLQIKLVPGHVCLHFNGVDIEATSGEFANYEKYKEVLPATEIISTNLLDLTDFREKVQEIEPRDMVKSAQLAYAISSLKSLVMKNLDTAYHNLAVAAGLENDFDTAIFYLGKTGDKETLAKIYHNAAAYHLKNENFSKARFYADKSGNEELVEIVAHNEGVYNFQKGKIDRALEIFTRLGDEKMQKACYSRQYNELVEKVKNDKTVDDAKKHKGVYVEMLSLARKMGEDTLEKGIEETLRKL